MTALMALASVVLVSAVSLVGLATLAGSERRFQGLSRGLVALAVGGLYGDAFLHLVPEAFAALGSGFVASLWIMGGILGFFILERIIRRRSLHHRRHHHLVELNLAGDALHNLVDGLLIGASYAASPRLGVTTTVAVLLHEIPQELGDFGILVRGGLTPRRALALNALSALTAVAGTLLALALGSATGAITAYLIPIIAGAFIYLAGSDLIPELQHEPDHPAAVIRQVLWIAGGVAVMAGLGLVV